MKQALLAENYGVRCRKMLVFKWKKGIRRILPGLLGAIFQQAWAVDTNQHQIVDGFSVYLGVLPAEMIRGHPKEHPESQMHGGFPTDYRHHIVVAVFDEDTSKRITNADVSARIVTVNAAGPDKKLEAMTIGGKRTYGNYFRMPGTGPYRIEIQIQLPGTPIPIKASFEWGKS